MFLEKIKSIYCGYTENRTQYIVYFGLCTTNPDNEVPRQVTPSKWLIYAVSETSEVPNLHHLHQTYTKRCRKPCRAETIAYFKTYDLDGLVFIKVFFCLTDRHNQAEMI